VDDQMPDRRKIIFDPLPRIDGIDSSGDPLTDVRADIYLLSGRRRPRPGRRKALTADMTTVQGLEQGGLLPPKTVADQFSAGPGFFPGLSFRATP